MRKDAYLVYFLFRSLNSNVRRISTFNMVNYNLTPIIIMAYIIKCLTDYVANISISLSLQWYPQPDIHWYHP